MSVVDTVRMAVVATNPWWPFSRLNKIPYLLALRAFVQMCRGYSEIKSVYLRHGMLRRDWVPALSDIDLTIVLEGDRTADAEFAFLRSYWRGHARFKSLFPMIGDVDILDERQVAAWTKWTIRGYEAKGWRLLYGTPTVRSQYRADPERLRHDAFEYGLLFYLGYFRGGYFANRRPSELRSLELERLAGGIARYLTGYATPSRPRGAAGVPPRRDRAGLLAWLLKHLEMNVPETAPVIGRGGSAGRQAAGRDGLEPAEAQAAHLPVGPSDPPALREGVECMYLADGDYFVVLRDGLEDAALRRCASVAWDRRHVVPGGPIVLSRRVFEYMLRVHAPLRYGSVAGRRELTYGRDIMRAIPPPTEAALVGHVLDQTDKVLTLPRRSRLFLPRDLVGAGRELLERELDRCLLMRLYLETGSIPRTRELLVAETRARYPEPYRELRGACDQLERDDRGPASRGLFGLFRSVARDVHQRLEQRDGLGHRAVQV